MTTPAAGDTTQLLLELRELLVAWRRSPVRKPGQGGDNPGPVKAAAMKGKAAPVVGSPADVVIADGPTLGNGDGIAERIAALDAALSAGGALPAPWAQASAAPAQIPGDAPAPILAAQAEVEAALASYHAAAAANSSAATDLEQAGKALGDARIKLADLARRADLERP